MEERYIASVDLGTSRLAVCVACVEDRNVQIIYYKESPSAGIRNSRVTNPGIAEKNVRDAITEAQQALKIKIQQVVVGLPRWQVRQETASASAEREDDSRFINENEIRFLKTEALKTYPLQDSKRELIYGAVAQSYATEDCINEPESEIIGMSAERLEGKFKVFIGSKRLSTNLDELFNSMQIGIARKFFIPGITAKAVLGDEEMKNGVALIDIGAGVSSVAIFKDNLMRYYAAIPFGGDSVTRDIESICGLSFRMAEEIKKAYGACLPDKLSTLGEKELHILGEDGKLFKKLSLKVLSEIINARMVEIINALLYKIQESGLSSEDYLRKGIVVTGGGAELLNCINLFKELSGYSVKLGLPKKYVSCDGCPEASEASASTAIGMILAVKGDKSVNSINDIAFRPSQRNGGSKAVQGAASNQDITNAGSADEHKTGNTVASVEGAAPTELEERPAAGPVAGTATGEEVSAHKPGLSEQSGTPESPDGNRKTNGEESPTNREALTGKENRSGNQGQSSGATEQPANPVKPAGREEQPVNPVESAAEKEQSAYPGKPAGGAEKPDGSTDNESRNPLVKFFWKLYDSVREDADEN